MKDFSHAKIIDDIIGANMELMQPQDKLLNTERERSRFTVRIEDRKELNETSIRPMPLHKDKINCFTDATDRKQS